MRSTRPAASTCTSWVACTGSRAPSARPGGRAARAVRAGGCGRPAGADVLGRHAAPDRSRMRARPPPEAALPGRADDGRRPRVARGALVGARPAARVRRLALPDDALPGGGRPAVRAAGDRRPRHRRRRGHARRAQGRDRRGRRDGGRRLVRGRRCAGGARDARPAAVARAGERLDRGGRRCRRRRLGRRAARARPVSGRARSRSPGRRSTTSSCSTPARRSRAAKARARPRAGWRHEDRRRRVGRPVPPGAARDPARAWPDRVPDADPDPPDDPLRGGLPELRPVQTASSSSSIEFLAAGQVALSVLVGAGGAGFQMVQDIDSGFFDKLRVAPIPRLSIVAGLLATDAVRLATPRRRRHLRCAPDRARSSRRGSRASSS